MNTITTRTSRYTLRPDGIVVQTIVAGDTHTVADAKENVAAFRRLAAGVKRPCLVDMRRSYSTDRGVREYYAGPEATEFCGGFALLVGSAATRMIGNLFLAMNRTPLPVRMFTDEAPAVEWLLRFRGA